MRILEIKEAWVTECLRSFTSDHHANTTDIPIPVTKLRFPDTLQLYWLPHIKLGSHYIGEQTLKATINTINSHPY